MGQETPDVEVLPPESEVQKRGRGRPSNLLKIAPPRPLTARVAVINDYHQAAVASLAQGAMYALLCGFELHAARAQIQHGGWEDWVSANCPFTTRTAHRYMEAAQRKYRDIPNLTHVSDFALGVAPHQLEPAQREQLIDAVKNATDGESVRQLYLELGLVKSSESARGGGARGGRQPVKLPDGETLAHHTAWGIWKQLAGKLDEQVRHHRSQLHLTEAELTLIKNTLNDARQAIDEALRGGTA